MVERALRWMPVALVCALFAGIALRASRPIKDPDDWWHLRLGNDLIDQHSLATPEHWSVFASVPWVPTEPFPEIVAAYVDRWAGLPGLAILYAVALLVVVGTIYAICRRHSRPLAATVATIASVLAASSSLTSRPQLCSFVLLPIIVAAWLRTEEDYRIRWWLVPVFWLWSLCHGFWFIGVAYGFAFVIGFALSRRMARSVLLRQAAVALGSLAVVALNPVGLGVLKAPFAVNSTSTYVVEWARTDLTSGAAISAMVMCVVTAAVWVRTGDGVTWAKVLVLLSAVFWTWYAIRTVAVAGVVMSPLFAAALERVVRSDSQAPAWRETAQARRTEIVSLATAALIATVAVAVAAPVTADQPGNVPTALDPALDRLPPGTRVFNAYILGGWIAWRHPDLEQYVDGLVTPYRPSHVRDYVVAEAAEPGWERIIAESGVKAALLGDHSRLAAQLANRGWVRQGTDDGYVLLTAPGELSPG